MPEGENSIVDIKKFLSTQENPVSTQEFHEFWNSLSDEEKEQFKNEKLPKDYFP